MTPDQQIEKIEQILGMLSARATGGFPNSVAYRELRDELLDDPLLAPKIPAVVRSHRSLDDWWGFIKTRFAKYDERREYLREQFEPLLQEIDEQRRARRNRANQPTTAAMVEEISRPKDWDDLVRAQKDRDLTRKKMVLAGGKFVPVESAPKPSTAVQARPVPTSKRVFVVHGHDDGTKEAVARLLENQALVPVILHEQPNRGRTVIEKFEKYADVGFAIVILTADDLGKAKAAPDLRPRARQNVLLELGYFIGALSRANVVALAPLDIEVPSDTNGVVYTELDRKGAWKREILNELADAGYSIDFSKQN